MQLCCNNMSNKFQMQLNCIYICSMKNLSHSQIDRLGITAAFACAVHCAALPLIITSLPLLGLEFLANIWIEITMICISIFLGCYSLSRSYPKHKNLMPVILLLSGFMVIAIGHFWLHEFESFLIPIGGMILALAHVVNWTLMKSCTHNHPTK